jgi:fluoride exporter
VNAVLAIALGGGLGAVARHGVGVLALRLFGPGFPWGTLIVNVAGCFVVGLAVAGFMRLGGISDTLRLFLTTGVLGGFTTFSAFSLDAMKLVQAGQWTVATAYVLASVVLSLLAVFAGFSMLRALAA